MALPVCQKLISSWLVKTSVEIWSRAEIVGIIKESFLPLRLLRSDIFIEFYSWNPQAEILFRPNRQPSEFKTWPKSLAIDLI